MIVTVHLQFDYFITVYFKKYFGRKQAVTSFLYKPSMNSA
jgi:hypothetical protein